MTVILFALIFTACSTASTFQYPAARWLRDTDNAPIEKPKVKEQKHAKEYDRYTQQAVEVLKFTENMASMPRNLTIGGRTEALNTNNFDEVADSTWFTNRIGRTGVFKNGFTTPPDLKNKFEILSTNKKEEPTEYVIKDSEGNEYLIKLDGSTNGMEGAGEVLGAIFLYSAGYNVTENYIVEFNGKRALAIRLPKGENIGHFSFNGKKKDDKNDRIPHEYRRELRGLRLFAAFLNNKEIGVNNNLDMYNGYVTHYLANYALPFADMRSEFTGGEPKRGTHTIDALFSFGMYNPYWTSADLPEEKGSGIISSKDFIPDKWQPINNNTAFKFMTLSDGFWAAKILAKFSNDDIKTIVGAASYKDQTIAETVAKELMVRRDKIVDYYFEKVAPMDDFSLQSFTDLAPAEGTRFRYKLANDKNTVKMFDWKDVSSATLDISSDALAKMHPKEFYVITLQLQRPNKDFWSPSVQLYLKKDPEPKLIGIKRRYNH